MQVSARSIITELLSVAESAGRPDVPVRILIDGCVIFGFSANTVRVTLVKLRQDGTVESPERGVYRLGSDALALSKQIMAWHSVGDRLVNWDGSWVGVFVGHLTRSDRAALGKRTRALRLTGFGELTEGLYVRPNNLRGGVTEMRTLLVNLGVEEAAVVTRLEELSDEDCRRALALWDGEGVVQGYVALREQLEESTERRAETSLEDAMREAFLLGREVIRWTVLDPLLPEAIVPGEERSALINAMKEYDRTGRNLWRQYLGVAESEEAA